MMGAMRRRHGRLQPARLLALAAFVSLLLTACTPSTRVSPLPSVAAAVTVPPAPVTPGVLSGTAEEGMASWYGPGFAGRTTSNGEVFDPALMTAAHRTLPFGTRVLVTNLANGRAVEVRINDRGPFKPGRIIDLSRAAAERIDMVRSGVARVRVEVLGGAPGSARLAGFAGLRPFEALSPVHAPGQLLVLRSDRGVEPVVVRVVAGEFPTELGADLLVAEALVETLGDTVAIHVD
jgi:hypothetical protein